VRQRQIDTRSPGEVEKQVSSIYRRLYPNGDSLSMSRAFEWAGQCFSGRFADYQPIDAKYHDFEHTLQGTLCLARLLEGRHLAGAKPAVSAHHFELTVLAILFHDTGYLKKRHDTEGTGAKYTPIHVSRSIGFAREFLGEKGYAEPDLQMIENMIRCTGLNVDLTVIPFQSDLERTLGFALGTADLLGQMAADDYVDKLPVLYQEFAEAARHDPGMGHRLTQYTTAEDLMRKTPLFWKDYVWPRINEDFGCLYKFLNDPFPDGPNPYLIAIEENMRRLEQKLAAL
jgi:hypothetical protein